MHTIQVKLADNLAILILAHAIRIKCLYTILRIIFFIQLFVIVQSSIEREILVVQKP